MSQLTQTIALLYRMQGADIKSLETSLLESRKRTWLTTLQLLAREHGCTNAPRAPRQNDLSMLKYMCAEDAKSIAATWNRDVTAQIERIYAENPRANRYTYFRRLEDWSRERDAWKLPQVALVTETTTAEYAREQFRRHNYDGGEKYILEGAPPTCDDCARLYAAGEVDKAFIDHYPCPRHIGCPHFWAPVTVPKVPCGELWLG